MTLERHGFRGYRLLKQAQNWQFRAFFGSAHQSDRSALSQAKTTLAEVERIIAGKFANGGTLTKQAAAKIKALGLSVTAPSNRA